MNFLVFVADQFSSCSLGANGNGHVRTPNLDELAAEGVSLTRAYCPNSVCMPSRASMITGLLPSQHGCYTNGTPLPEDVPTITQALVDHGYRTHSVGKLHLQPFLGVRPEEDQPAPHSWESRVAWDEGSITQLPSPYYGFQSADYVHGHVHYAKGNYLNWLRENHPESEKLYQRAQGKPVPGEAPGCWKLSIPEEQHYNRWIADRAVAFLDSLKQDEPFFLWCSFPDPHHPFAACAPYSEMYDPESVPLNPTWNLQEDTCSFLRGRRYEASSFDEEGLRQIVAQTYGMITHVDDCIGQVVSHLDKLGLDENTVIVFMSDHGEYLGAHHLLHKSVWPLEELQRVPFVWYVPGGHPTGRDASVTSLLDFAPTVLDYAGLDESVLNRRGDCFERRSDPLGLPGRSLRPVLDKGEGLASKPVLIEYDEDSRAGTMLRMRTLVEDRYKLTLFPRHGEGLLVDLQEDPNETRNLWDDPQHAAARQQMTESLLEELIWRERLDQPRLSGA